MTNASSDNTATPATGGLVTEPMPGTYRFGEVTLAPAAWVPAGALVLISTDNPRPLPTVAPAAPTVIANAATGQTITITCTAAGTLNPEAMEAAMRRAFGLILLEGGP